MAFPREAVKKLIYDLVIDGEDGIISKAQTIHSDMIPSYIAARSVKPEDGLAKPILGALLPTEVLIGSSIERSMSTSMGWRLDTIFTKIASKNYDFAFGGKGKYVEISGVLTPRVISVIEQMMSDFTNKKKRKKPNDCEEREIIKNAVKEGGKPSNPTTIRTDIYFLDSEEEIEYCLESKTIKPNKGQLESVKRDALLLIALKETGLAKYTNSLGDHIPTGNEIRPILGTYYDAWGSLVNANFPTIDTFFERGSQFVSGSETWALVGKDVTTYDLFMSLLWEIHCERKDDLAKAFKGEI